MKWNPWARYFFFNGADQLALYSARYYLLYALFAALFLVALAMDARSRWREGGFWDAWGIPLQLYLAVGMASVLLPSIVALPQYEEPLSYLIARLSSVSGILACWMLGAMKPRKWHAAGYALIAVVFFAFLYIDTGTLNKMEEQVERAVAALPAGHRVVEDIDCGDGFQSGDRAHRGSRLHRTVFQLRQLRACDRAVSHPCCSREFDRHGRPSGRVRRRIHGGAGEGARSAGLPDFAMRGE